MTASCLSCHQSSARAGDDLLRCRLFGASVRAEFVCMGWVAKGGQGSCYGFPGALDEYQAREVSESGFYVIPGQTAMGGSK